MIRQGRGDRMAKFIEWIRSAAVKAFDPRREDRIAWYAAEARRLLKEQRRDFDLQSMMLAYGAEPEDEPLVAERVYESALRKAWKDAVLTDQERKSLLLVAGGLRLDSRMAHQIEARVGLRVFEEAMGHAFADGDISPDESQRLDNIAAGLGTTKGELLRYYFLGEGEGFLRGMFAEMMQGQVFSGVQWEKLVQTAAAMGLTSHDLHQAIWPQAEHYVEHVLADAKADEAISPQERKVLQWLASTFNLSPAFRDYVNREVQVVDAFTAIRRGHLPTVPVSDVALRAGEVAHHHARGVYAHVRQTRGGSRVDEHEGMVTLTDYRMLFSGATKSLEVNHRRVVSLLPFEGGVEVRSSGKGSGFYHLGGSDTRMATAIYQVAVGKANQTVVQQGAATSTRHIPRDVRQRVWQRYGGRCAECASDQYLEYDHIVPVAKGGSNSDANVQLLCRGCNGRKSDLI